MIRKDMVIEVNSDRGDRTPLITQITLITPITPVKRSEIPLAGITPTSQTTSTSPD